jgi:adenosylmethionine-8-amino-7-oxononanoate aminotransferase
LQEIDNLKIPSVAPIKRFFNKFIGLTLRAMHSNLITRDLQVIWHPFTPQKNSPPPVAISSGQGVYLYDENGNLYIDAISSWWVNLHGHAHPYIAEKLYEQAKKLEQVIFAGFTHEPAIQLAERLIEILPGQFSKVFYSDNGSTSVEVALKMAIQYWWNNDEPKRNKIIAFNNSYHGDTFGAMSVSDRGVFTLAFHNRFFEVIFIDTPGADADMQQIFAEINLDEVACFIYEPIVQGAGGMKIYDVKRLDDLLGAMKKHKVICIADEVMTGFGRTGKLFASEYLSENPDIVCLSKGLTGGTMALGVTACTAQIHAAFVQDDRLKTFFHGHSFTANPLACATALASLDLLLNDDCRNRIQFIAKMHEAFIEKINRAQQFLLIQNLRQLGTILAFEIALGKDEYLNTISSTITRKMMELGIYLRPLGNTVYVMPPYCITENELSKVYDAIEKVIENLGRNRT